MAAFTSATTGNWNDGATWGNSSPGTKGTDWPGLAGDTATIADTHVVTYNVSETNQLGVVTVNSGGTLTFSTTMDTLLTLGDVDLYISGTLNVGTIASPIDAAYTAKIIINSTSSANEFVNLLSSSITLCGDPDLFGSTSEAVLASNWTTGTTFTVVGDLTASWSSGQTLVLVKDGEYSSQTTDIVEVTIDTVAANGDDTDITINESFPGGTYSTGATVWHLTRNVVVVLNGTEDFVFNSGDSSCGEADLDGGPADGLVIHSAQILNCYVFKISNCAMDYAVINNSYGINSLEHVTGDYNFFGYSDGNSNTTIKEANGSNWAVIGFDGPLDFNKCVLNNLRYLLCLDNLNNYLSKHSYISFAVYKNYSSSLAAPFSASDNRGSIYTGHLGENENGLSYITDDNLISFYGSYTYEYTYIKDLKCPLSSPPLAMANGSYGPCGVFIEAWDGDATDPRLYASHGEAVMVDADGTGSEPNQRSGGNDTVWKFTAYSNCDYDYKIKMPIKFSYYTGAETLTFNLYMQTDYVGGIQYRMSLIHNDLVSTTTGTVSTRSNQSDWTQKATITETFSKAGWAEIVLYVWGYEASKYLWIDPLIEVT